MRQRCLANHGSNRLKEGHSVYWMNAFGNAAVASPRGEVVNGARQKATNIAARGSVLSGRGHDWRWNREVVGSGALGGEQRAGCSRAEIALDDCSEAPRSCGIVDADVLAGAGNTVIM